MERIEGGFYGDERLKEEQVSYNIEKPVSTPQSHPFIHHIVAGQKNVHRQRHQKHDQCKRINPFSFPTMYCLKLCSFQAYCKKKPEQSINNVEQAAPLFINKVKNPFQKGFAAFARYAI